MSQQNLDRFLAGHATPILQYASEFSVQSFDPVRRVDHRSNPVVIGQIREAVAVTLFYGQFPKCPIAALPLFTHPLPVIPAFFRMIIWIVCPKDLAQILGQFLLVLCPYASQQASLDVRHTPLHRGSGINLADRLLDPGETVCRQQADPLQPSLSELFKNHLPSCGTLSGKMNNRQHLTFPLRSDSQYHIERFMGHTLSANLDLYCINKNNWIIGLQGAPQPLTHVLAHPLDHSRDGRRAIIAPVEVLKDLPDLLLCQSLAVQGADKLFDLGLLTSQQSQYLRVEFPIAIAGDTKFKNPALSICLAVPVPVSLVITHVLQRGTTLRLHHRVEHHLHNFMQTVFALQVIANQRIQLYFV